MKQCCDRPAIQRFDYKIRDHLSDSEVRMVNRVCIRCYRHWYGPIDEVKEYTNREWESYINSEAK
jgi:hypothetical protein